jgi:hypothetical protein
MTGEGIGGSHLQGPGAPAGAETVLLIVVGIIDVKEVQDLP